jgi:hypothetical protein
MRQREDGDSPFLPDENSRLTVAVKELGLSQKVGLQ